MYYWTSKRLSRTKTKKITQMEGVKLRNDTKFQCVKKDCEEDIFFWIVYY